MPIPFDSLWATTQATFLVEQAIAQGRKLEITSNVKPGGPGCRRMKPRAPLYRCPHCGHEARRYARLAGDTLAKCKACALIFLFPYPDRNAGEQPG